MMKGNARKKNCGGSAIAPVARRCVSHSFCPWKRVWRGASAPHLTVVRCFWWNGNHPAETECMWRAKFLQIQENFAGADMYHPEGAKK